VTNPYKQILVAIDCSEESTQVLGRAAALAERDGTHLHLIHVIEPLALAYGADVPMDVSDLQSSLVKQARDSAMEYAHRYQVPDSQVHVELGSIEKTIQETAEKLDCDLIVVGSHTRSGLAILLGSTAKGLVPGANCDVLAVKITDA
jgi:universal stress protein A